MKLTDLRVNHVQEPLGFQLKPVSFSWVVAEPGAAKKKKAARIRVLENGEEIFDSGYDEKADNRDYPAALSLKPRTRYTWSVEVTADNGETAAAESWFETGKMEEPWTGKWITPDLDPAIQPDPPEKIYRGRSVGGFQIVYLRSGRLRGLSQRREDRKRISGTGLPFLRFPFTGPDLRCDQPSERGREYSGSLAR